MLGFRWLQRFRLPLGFRSTISRGGVGYSWGIPGLRVGRSPSGRKWLSIGLPGTGLSFFKYISKQPSGQTAIFVDDDEFVEFPLENRTNHPNQSDRKTPKPKDPRKKAIKKWKDIR